MQDELEPELTDQYDIHDLFAMCDLNETATDKEIKAKTESIILSYLRMHNVARANFFQEVQRRLLSNAIGTPDMTNDQQQRISPAPIHTKRSQLVTIHSQFRSDYYKQSSTDYQFTLSDVMKTTSIRLAAVEIPRMYNTISSLIGNSTMLVYNDSTWNAWLVTIPDGNYDVSVTLTDGYFDRNVEAINTAVRSSIPGRLVSNDFVVDETVGILDERDLVYSIDTLTHKSAFTSESGVVNSIRFNVDENGAVDASKMEKFGLGCSMGFRYAERSFVRVLVSEGVAFLSGPSYWFISIDDFLSTPHSEPFIVAYNGWNSTNNILSRVSVAHDSERRIIRSHLSQPRNYKGTADIQKLRIQLLDEYGRQVDINDMDWSLVLEFETLELGWDCD